MSRSPGNTARLVALLLVVFAALSAWAEDASASRSRRLLLLSQGPDGHAAGSHEYVAGIDRLSKSLADTPGLSVQIVRADEPWTEGPALLSEADGVVLYLAEGARWTQADPRRAEALVRLAARGGGISALHWAIGTKKAEPIEAFLKLLGGCHGGPDRKYQVVETELRLLDREHPILRGFGSETFRARDEFYYRLKFVRGDARVRPLVAAMIDGQPETVAWAWQRPDGGRSFGFSGLHFDTNWELPEYLRLVTQGVQWTMKASAP